MARREIGRSMVFQEKSGPALPLQLEGNNLLYLHIPFCEELCPYCSFNRTLYKEDVCRRYFRALRAEVLLYKQRNYNFSGVYIGGGTPTILIDELEETIALIRATFPVREISVETNPNHLNPKYLDPLRRAGIDRLSVGVQSFDDGLLRAMDRYKKYGSGKEIAQRLKASKSLFPTLNADMIFNFPTQTEKSLESDLEIITDSGLDQVTFYPLMVSESTRSLVQKTLGSVDFRKEEHFYKKIAARLVPPYRFSSVWCFSRQDSMPDSIPDSIIDEYIVNYSNYAGLGSGSIGYIDGICYANTFDIEEYIRLVNSGEIPVMASRKFGMKEQVRYEFLMSIFGMSLDLKVLRDRFGKDFDNHIWHIILPFYLAGALRYDSGKLYPTPRGRYLAVVMMREFFTAVNNFRDFCRRNGNG
jgi:coproporphyrinogen III oxidase-like Fe-S oxidoreductase